MLLGKLRVAAFPGQASAVIVEPFDEGPRWKIVVPTWTIDEMLNRKTMSHDERRAFVERKLAVIGRIAETKIAHFDEQPDGPRLWITIEADDFRRFDQTNPYPAKDR
jgi:hypothetical protein